MGGRAAPPEAHPEMKAQRKGGEAEATNELRACAAEGKGKGA